MAIYRYDHIIISMYKQHSQGVSYSFVQISCLHTNKVIVLVMNHTHYILSLTIMYASTELLEVLDYDEINL